MPWSTLQFGKHKGKSLPQVLFNDPDWFFWAYHTDVFKGRSMVEAEKLYEKATKIRIPTTESVVAEYGSHPGMKGICSVEVVPSARPPHTGSTRTFRLPVLNLEVPYSMADYDKLGYRIFLRSLKFYLFGNETCRMTRQRCDSFFDDPNNFA